MGVKSQKDASWIVKFAVIFFLCFMSVLVFQFAVDRNWVGLAMSVILMICVAGPARFWARRAARGDVPPA